MQRFIFSIGLIFLFLLCTSAICFKKETNRTNYLITTKNNIQNDTLPKTTKTTPLYTESKTRYFYDTILLAIALFLTWAVSISAVMLRYPKLLNYILIFSIVLLLSSIIDLVLHFSNKKKYPKIIFWDALTRLFVVVAGFIIWNKYR